jgi:hypothetical protein
LPEISRKRQVSFHTLSRVSQFSTRQALDEKPIAIAAWNILDLADYNLLKDKIHTKNRPMV